MGYGILMDMTGEKGFDGKQEEPFGDVKTRMGS